MLSWRLPEIGGLASMVNKNPYLTIREIALESKERHAAF
jgi:hypothetical protein